MAKTPRPTLFGQHPAPEREMLEAPVTPLANTQLKVVRWTPPIPILDQEDLLAQGIHTSKFIPRCQTDSDALGSCTANATTASLAERWVAAGKSLEDAALTSEGQTFALAGDSVTDEEFAITFYNQTTETYGGIGGNWPPNDEGSSGIFCCDELEKHGLIRGHKSASSIEGLLTLLQEGTVIVGGPWYNSMMSPDPKGFIDGDGSPEAIRDVLDSGIAGGHERCVCAIVELVLTPEGQIDFQKTILEDRNSWDPSWGLKGSYRYHASFLKATLDQTDWKSFTIV